MNGNFRVGEFLIEPEINSITRNGTRTRIEPKVMQVLVCLAEYPSTVVPKEKLIRSVWADTFVTDDVLTRSISELRKVFEDDAKEPRFIQTIPRSGYRLVAPVSYAEEEGQKNDPAVPIPARRARFFWAAAVLIGGSLLVGAVLYALHEGSKATQPPLSAIPLTTDPGWEGTPSFSPDGNYVVFSAGGGVQHKDFDLYVIQIGGGAPRRLTSDPAIELGPTWSPDGRSIAFVRRTHDGDKLEVLVIPSLGGPERKITETVPDNSTGIFHSVPPYLCWSSDSKYLVTADRASPGEPLSLFVWSVATGERRRLTTPPATAVADGNPAVSPDGRTLAFVRVITAGNPQLYMLPLSDDLTPAGEARRREIPLSWVVSPAWSADGRELICSAGGSWGVGARLWRVSVFGSEKSEPLASVGDDGSQPAISRQGHRLVYAHWTGDHDIWRIEVSGKGRGSPAVKLIASTRDDGQGQYSPDGSRIVFSSGRTGHGEIWSCSADGSNPAELTYLESNCGSPRWFPDGRRIVFDLNREGHTDVYMIDITTLVPHRLTNEPSDDFTPSVSHDGKWIYFSSRRTGRSEIWRMPAEGGEAVQMTRQGGVEPFESLDGKLVYYRKDQDVWQVPALGGEEIRLFGPIAQNSFAVAADGIYFIEVGTPGHAISSGNLLKFFSFATGTAEKVADLRLYPEVDGPLGVSPDGRYVLADLFDLDVCDLMLVENFH